MKGVKPATLQNEALKEDKQQEPEVMKLDADIFSEFSSVDLMDIEMYDTFQYLCYSVLINYILKRLLKV
jgi:hypothetical protein